MNPIKIGSILISLFMNSVSFAQTNAQQALLMGTQVLKQSAGQLGGTTMGSTMSPMGSTTGALYSNQGFNSADLSLFPGCELPTPLNPMAIPRCLPPEMMGQAMQMQNGQQGAAMSNYSVMQQIAMIQADTQTQMNMSRQCMETRVKQTGDNLLDRVNSFQTMIDQIDADKENFEKATEAVKKSIMESQGILYGTSKNLDGKTIADRLKGTACGDAIGTSGMNGFKKSGLSGLREEFKASYESLIADDLSSIGKNVNSSTTTTGLIGKLSSFGSKSLFNRKITKALDDVNSDYKNKVSAIKNQLSDKFSLNNANVDSLIEAAAKGDKAFASEMSGVCYRNTASQGFSQALGDIQKKSNDTGISASERSFYNQIREFYEKFNNSQITFEQLKAGVQKVTSAFANQNVSIKLMVAGATVTKNYAQYLTDVSNTCASATGFLNGSSTNSNAQQFFQDFQSLTPANVYSKFANDVATTVKNCGNQLEQVYNQEKSVLASNVGNYNTAYMNLHQKNILTFNKALSLFNQEKNTIKALLPGTNIQLPEGMTISNKPASHQPDELGGELTLLGGRSLRGDSLFGLQDIEQVGEKLSQLKQTISQQRENVLAAMQDRIGENEKIAQQNLKALQDQASSCQSMTIGAGSSSQDQSRNPLVFCRKYDMIARNPAAGCSMSKDLYNDSMSIMPYLNADAVTVVEEFNVYCNSAGNSGSSEDDTASSSNELSLDSLCQGDNWENAKETLVARSFPPNFLNRTQEEIATIKKLVLSGKPVSSLKKSDLKEYLEESGIDKAIDRFTNSLSVDTDDLYKRSVGNNMSAECDTKGQGSKFCQLVDELNIEENSNDLCVELSRQKQIRALSNSLKYQDNGTTSTKAIIKPDGSTETKTTKEKGDIDDDASMSSYQEKLDDSTLDEVDTGISSSIINAQKAITRAQGASLGQLFQDIPCSQMSTTRRLGQKDDDGTRTLDEFTGAVEH